MWDVYVWSNKVEEYYIVLKIVVECYNIKVWTQTRCGGGGNGVLMTVPLK
jgi:hypothetical protein